MGRTVALAALMAALMLGCILPPGDAAQIRRLVRDESAAVSRGDSEVRYRMHDLDFRAVCPLDRFRALPPPTPAVSTHDIEIQGVRGWATVSAPDGTTARRFFIKDAGRWYVYGNTLGCLQGVGHRESRAVDHLAARLPTPDARLPAADAARG